MNREKRKCIQDYNFQLHRAVALFQLPWRGKGRSAECLARSNAAHICVVILCNFRFLFIIT